MYLLLLPELALLGKSRDPGFGEFRDPMPSRFTLPAFPAEDPAININDLNMVQIYQV